jgi:hypothetical protein
MKIFVSAGSIFEIFQGERKEHPLCGLQLTNNVEKSQKGRSPWGWGRNSPAPALLLTHRSHRDMLVRRALVADCF